MKKNALLLYTTLFFTSNLYASQSSISDNFEPIFRKPPSVTYSLKKIIAGTALAYVGDYLYPYEERSNVSQTFVSEGPSIVGHTLIMSGLYDLFHWGYDRFMHSVYRHSTPKTKRQVNPEILAKKEEALNQTVNLKWNRLSTGVQIGSSLINSAVATYYYAQTSSQILSGSSEATEFQSLLHPALLTLSTASLLYSLKKAKAYVTHKRAMDYEPPLLSIASSLGQLMIGSHMKNTYGQTLVYGASISREGCYTGGFKPDQFIELSPRNVLNSPTELVSTSFFQSQGYWQCVQRNGSIIPTRLGEFLAYNSEFKILDALRQMGVNATNLFRTRPRITEANLELEPPTIRPVHQHSSDNRRARHGVSSASFQIVSDYPNFIGETSNTRYKPEPVKKKEKRRGIPWSTHEDQEQSESHPYNLQESAQYQALQAINECRRYNTVKKSYIDALLNKTCRFVGGYIESDSGNGRNIILEKNNRRVKIFYEEPHGKTSSDYTGYKLKRVLNAMETAYAYRWNQEGIHAYLIALGKDTFYTIPKNMLHILWDSETL